VPGKEAGPEALPDAAEQHCVVEVVEKMPLLLVDGEASPSPLSTTFFIHHALGPDDEGVSLFQPRVTSVDDLSPALLTGKQTPRVVVLADVARLSDAQSEAIDRYLAQGGSVFVLLGPRAAKNIDSYNQLHASGLGWFPAHLQALEGAAGKPDDAARISLAGLMHPALEFFRDPVRGLDQARFPRWLAATPGKTATAIAFLDVGQPFLMEAAVGKGKLLLATVPFDRSWDGNFPTLHAYPVLVHQLLYYLADAGDASWRVAPGQSVHWKPASGEGVLDLPSTVLWNPPDGAAIPFVIDRLPWLGPTPDRPGAYALMWGTARKAWFVLPPEVEEYDLTPLTEEDARAVARVLPITNAWPPPDPTRPTEGDDRIDLWWLLFLLVVGMLCLEIWFTRRMALRQQTV
jgi:hypothetical protein